MRPTRFARRRERTRRELLAAATEVLARKGMHDTKIADVAAAADVGVGTVYLHFDTKEALVDAVIDAAVGRMKTTIDAAREAAGNPIAKVRAANAAFCRFARENREVFRIVFGHAAAHHDVIRRAQDVFAADAAATIRAGIAEGTFAPVAVEPAAQAVVGMATQLLSWWTAHEAVPIEVLEETMTRLALDGLLARTGAERSR
ncbi:MAG TPA: TetR family transcriptional regulator [Candidatus Binatia bacterium]|nr:TetR family transcriptional regulator [Candidatus Binatia bacterium]